MNPEIEEKIRGWVAKGAPCEHKDQEGKRDCQEPSNGGVPYDIGIDEDCVLGCRGHLPEIRKELEEGVVVHYIGGTERQIRRIVRETIIPEQET